MPNATRAGLRLLLAGLCALLLGGLAAWGGSNVFASPPQSPASQALPRQLSSDMVPSDVRDGAAQAVGAHSATDKLTVLFMLPMRDRAGLDAFLANAADPRSAAYNKYLTQAEANARFNPDPAHESSVVSWLQAHGVADVKTQPNHLFVMAHMDTATAQALLSVSINDYKEGSRAFYSADRAATLPAEVSADVSSIVGLDNAVQYQVHSIIQPAGGKSPTGVEQKNLCPAQFAAAYNVTPLLSSGVNGAGINVAITLWTKTPTDSVLASWASTYCPGSAVATRANGRLSEIFVEGYPSTDTDDGEAALDIESISGLASGAHVSYYEATAAYDANLAVALNAAGTDPNVQLISNSWGAPETSTHKNDLDSVLASNTATGHVYLFSSGDDGSWALGTQCGGDDPWPNYPAASAYVLSIGGTRFINTVSSGYPGERTWDYDPVGNTNGCSGGDAPEGSGGGYSRLTSRPSWQVAPGLANNGKRGYPDVAADADPGTGALICTNKYGCVDIGGTSLACPLWAAMLAITDQKIHADGKPYFNQPGQTIYGLYATAAGKAAFHDITAGTNGAYDAGPDWDAVTGLGSVDLNAFIPAYEATLPGGAPSPSPTKVPGQIFNDVPPANSFYEQIQWAYNANIINGYNCGSPEPCPGLYFRPGSNATRQQVAKMLVQATGLGSEAPGAQVFPDVQPSSPFYNFIQIAAHHGWISGFADGKFHPGDNVTRGQFSKMVSNAAAFNDAIPQSQRTFEDVPSSNTYWLYVERVYQHSVVSGYNCNSAPDVPCVGPSNRPYFRVGSNITRGQLAKIISKSFGGP